MNQPAFQQVISTWDESKEALNSQEEILQALTQHGEEEGPGKFLKKLRELAERPEASFAAELGLSLHQLKALEADDFDNLPAPIYMKSYFQRYCAMLNVPDDEFIRIYNALRENELPQLNRVSIKDKLDGTQISLGWLKYVSIAVVIGVIIFIIQSLDLTGVWEQAVNSSAISDQATELSIPQRKVEEVPPEL